MRLVFLSLSFGLYWELHSLCYLSMWLYWLSTSVKFSEWAESERRKLTSCVYLRLKQLAKCEIRRTSLGWVVETHEQHLLRLSLIVYDVLFTNATLVGKRMGTWASATEDLFPFIRVSPLFDHFGSLNEAITMLSLRICRIDTFFHIENLQLEIPAWYLVASQLNISKFSQNSRTHGHWLRRGEGQCINKYILYDNHPRSIFIPYCKK